MKSVPERCRIRSMPSENHLLELRDFKLLAEVTRIAVSWPASSIRSVNLSCATIPDSTRSSSQYAVSSNSCSALSVLLIISASERLRLHSLSCAPTEVPDRSTCFPMTPPTVVLGRVPYSRMIRNANSLVRTNRSLGAPVSAVNGSHPSSQRHHSRIDRPTGPLFIIPHSSFIFFCEGKARIDVHRDRGEGVDGRHHGWIDRAVLLTERHGGLVVALGLDH